VCKFCNECEVVPGMELCEACAEHLLEQDIRYAKEMDELLYNEAYTNR